MTTIERERPRLHSPHVEPERPVFVADHGRRARLVRFVAGAVAVVAALWLVALAAGMLGFGRLPGISIPVDRVVGGGGEADRPSSHDRGTQAPAPSAERISASAGVTSPGNQASPRSRARPSRPSTVAARPSARPRARRPQAPLPPEPVQPQPQPVQPPPAQQGWARRGQPAPPGHARQAQPEPPPTALNNGQAKKLLPPPPPPPPGPGNGNGNGGGPKKP